MPVVSFLLLLPSFVGLLRWIGIQIRGEPYDAVREIWDLLVVQLCIVTTLTIIFGSIGLLRLRDWMSRNRQNMRSPGDERVAAERESS